MEFEVESSKITVRSVQCKDDGVSTDIRGPETGSGEDSGHLADARTGRRYSTKAILGDGDLPWKIHVPPVRDDRTSETIGGQGCRVPVAGTAL